MRRNHLSSGFTLIELLVVVGIIAVLASLLFPVVGAITRNARQTACAENERQILGAMLAYTANNDNRFCAPAVCWSGSNGIADFKTGYLWPYIGPSIQSRANTMHCPADTLEQLCTYGGVDVPQPPYRNFSYSQNVSISTVPPQGPIGIRLSQVVHPEAHVWLYEEFAPNDVFCYGPSDVDDWLTGRHGGPGTIEHRTAYLSANWRNDGRGNVGYFDGHVAIMSVSTYFGSTYHFGPLNQ